MSCDACGIQWVHGYLGLRPEAEVGELGVYNAVPLNPARLTGLLMPGNMDGEKDWDWLVTSLVVDEKEQLACSAPLAVVHKILENPYLGMLARKHVSLTFSSSRGIIAWPIIAIRCEFQTMPSPLWAPLTPPDCMPPNPRAR